PVPALRAVGLSAGAGDRGEARGRLGSQRTGPAAASGFSQSATRDVLGLLGDDARVLLRRLYSEATARPRLRNRGHAGGSASMSRSLWASVLKKCGEARSRPPLSAISIRRSLRRMRKISSALRVSGGVKQTLPLHSFCSRGDST